MECTIPVLAFPAEAGPHLSTTEGWKAELATKGLKTPAEPALPHRGKLLSSPFLSIPHYLSTKFSYSVCGSTASCPSGV